MSLPTNDEQEMLERINRLRADPGGEFSRLILGFAPPIGVTAEITSAINFFGVDVNLFRQQMLSLTAAAPLAWNTQLNDAAASHSARMIGSDSQSHQLPGEPSPGQRMLNAGYLYASFGENIFAFATSVLQAHAAFVIDWGGPTGGMQDPPGHRQNLMSATSTEIGIDITPETNPTTSVGPMVITEDIGTRRDAVPQFVGVAYRDANGDAFYEAGEGVAGASVTATGAAGSFTTTTWSTGGYQLAVPQGTYTLTFSGGGLSGSKTVQATLGASNVKIDDIDAGGGAAFAVFNTTTNQSVVASSHTYTGPVSGLRNEYINITSDSLNISAATDGWFIHSGDGTDGIAVHGGTNVLDGGNGSNFLTGGTGTDTFFVDDRVTTSDVWSTVDGFHAGDSATIWGVRPADFTLNWVDGEGASGHTGLTLHALAPGKPTASLTLAGYMKSDLTNGRLSVQFGTDTASGSAYMYIHGNS